MQERIQKIIAQAGIASRRAAEELIVSGEVTVNGEIIRELGTKADPNVDHIKVSGKLINPILERREEVYVLLNKPKGILSSVSDTERRKLVTDLIPKSFGKLHPVGRLDFNTEGIIILTNDGELTNFATSPQSHIPKVYEAKVKGIPPEVLIEKLRRGVKLDDNFTTSPSEIRMYKHTPTNAWFAITLYEGHNQQIRKMFDAIGHSVMKLKRVRIGGFTDKWLNVGEFRVLSEEEIRDFKNKKFEKDFEKKKLATKRFQIKQTALEEKKRLKYGDSKARTSGGKIAGIAKRKPVSTNRIAGIAKGKTSTTRETESAGAKAGFSSRNERNERRAPNLRTQSSGLGGRDSRSSNRTSKFNPTEKRNGSTKTRPPKR